MNVRFICVGKMKERFYIEAFSEYAKRLSPYCRLELLELREERLHESPSEAEIQNALDKEAKEIVLNVPSGYYLVALCVEGRLVSSEDLAQQIRARQNSGKPDLCFVIGGSFGLAESIKKRADFCLSISRMTFPHHLARVILAEQVYRGFKILEGSRYHK